MKKLLLILLFLLFAPVLPAADVYYAATATAGNTGVDCVHAYGILDATNGFNAKLNPGDTGHACGAFTGPGGTTFIIISVSGTSGNPITLKFESGAIFSAPYWNLTLGSAGGAIRVTGNYVTVDLGTNGIIENTLNGTPGATCANSTPCSVQHLSDLVELNGTHDILKNGSTLGTYVHAEFVSPAITTCTASGTTYTCNFASSLSANFCAAGLYSDGSVTVLRSSVASYNSDNSSGRPQGWTLLTCSGSAITFTGLDSNPPSGTGGLAGTNDSDRNITGSAAVSINGDYGLVTRTTGADAYAGIAFGGNYGEASWNTWTRCNHCYSLAPYPSDTTNNVIDNNDCHDMANWDQPDNGSYHHNCMMVFNDAAEKSINTLIYDNYFYGMNSNDPVYAASHNTALIFIDMPSNEVPGMQIFNNVLAPTVGIYNGAPSGWLTGSAEFVANNTFVGPQANICWSESNYATAIVYNNICINGGSENAGGGTPPNVATFDYNLYYANGGGAEWPLNPAGATTWVGWQTLGYDLHGWQNPTTGAFNPLLNSDQTPATYSFAINSGKNLTSLGIAQLNQTAPQTFGASGSCGTGCVARPASGPWTLGAYSYTGAAPTGCALTWTNGYNHCRPVAIGPTITQNTNQTNFPVMICFNTTLGDAAPCPLASDMKTVANGGVVTSSSGYDIIFTSDNSGSTKLSWEMEGYTATSGVVIFYVKIPVLSHTADNTIYMFLGNAAVTTFQGGSAGAAWNSAYVGVYHLPNGSSLTANDSTSNANNGTNHSATAIAGLVDGGAAFNGTSTYIDAGTPSSMNLTHTGTIEFWTNPNIANVNYPVPLSNTNVDNDRNGVQIYFYSNGSGAFEVNSASARNIVAVTPGVPTVGIWQHYAGTFDGSNLVFYENGISIGTTSQTVDAVSGVYPWTIGQDGAHSSADNPFYNGGIDEVRISNTGRSADWIWTEYLSTVEASNLAVGAFQQSGSAASAPSCSPTSGTYSSAQSVSCSTITSGVSICYTTDGTTPATNGVSGCTTGTLYSVNIGVPSSLTLKVIAGGTGYADSSVTSYSYVISALPLPPSPALIGIISN